MKNLLEKIIEDKIYDDLGNWCLPNLGRFSSGKNLFEYQQNALELRKREKLQKKKLNIYLS